MTTRTPLVVVNGHTQQMPTGDAVPLTHGGTGATTAGDALTALGAVPSTRALTMTAPLTITGGGDLSADRTLGLSYDTTLQVVGGALGVSSLVALATHTHTPASIGAEIALGNPGTSGYVLSSTTGGSRSWVPQGAFSGILGASQGGTGVNNGANTLTVPASGTAALLNVAQTFSAVNTFSAGLNVGSATGAGAGQIKTSGGVSVGAANVSGVTMRTTLTSTAYAIIGTYSAGYALPGLVWTTTDNGAGIPKAGIWGAFNSSGSYLYLGTSNNYSIGITNYALTLDPSGNAAVAGALTIGGNTALHAANYSSYALSLSGGTVTGAITSSGFIGYHNGVNSGLSGGYYHWGYQESGAWTHPYPDLVIAYHTGMKFGANTSYGGMRFYADHPFLGPAELFSIGNGDSNVRVANNLYVGGNLALHAGNYTNYAPTLLYQATDPAAGTYRFLLGNGTNAGGGVYNLSSLYFNSSTATIMGANISGNAESLSRFLASTSVNPISGTYPYGADGLSTNAIGYVNAISILGQGDGALYSQYHNAGWQHQIYGDYRSGQIAVRGKNNGTWQSWRTVLDHANTGTELVAGGDSHPGNNRLLRTNSSGYTYLYYINSVSPANENGVISQIITMNDTDTFYRKSSISQLTAAVQATASGTWGINVTGTANRANYLNTLNVTDMNTILPAGVYQANSPANQPYGAHWHWLQMPYGENSEGYAAQIAISLYSDTMMFRSQQATDWGVWRTVIDSGNIAEAWRSNGFQSGWSDYPFGGYNPFGFWKDAMGVVHLRGLILRANDNTGQTVIAHLPGGYIPAARELHVCMSQSGPLRVDVDRGDGSTYCNIVVMDALPAGNWVSLDGFTFRTT